MGIKDTIYIERYNIQLDKDSVMLTPPFPRGKKKILKFIPIKTYYTFLLGDRNQCVIFKNSNKKEIYERWEEINGIIDMAKEGNIIPFAAIKNIH